MSVEGHAEVLDDLLKRVKVLEVNLTKATQWCVTQELFRQKLNDRVKALEEWKVDVLFDDLPNKVAAIERMRGADNNLWNKVQALEEYQAGLKKWFKDTRDAIREAQAKCQPKS